MPALQRIDAVGGARFLVDTHVRVANQGAEIREQFWREQDYAPATARRPSSDPTNFRIRSAPRCSSPIDVA